MEQPKKYIKVAVTDRLPKEDGKYFVWVDSPNARHKANPAEYNMDKKFYDKSDIEFKSFYEVTHWLDTVPDRESELIEMLEEIIRQNEFRGYGESTDAIEARKLIQSVKQTK